MNTLSNRLLSLAAVTTVAVLHSAGAAAAPKAGVPVFNDRAAASALQLPAQAKAQTGIVGTLNSAALAASGLELTLADGSKITARLERVAKDDAKGTQSWIGTFDDAPGSVLVLSKVKGVVTGVVNYKGQTLEILPTRGGKHLLYGVDETRLPPMSEPDVVDSADVATDGGYGASGTADTLPGSGVVHDVLVVYTAASAMRYGAATLESMIQTAMQSANQAYLNSQVGITMNLAGTGQVDVIEGSSMGTTKGTLQSSAAVAKLRDQVGADVVMLVSENSDSCGMASLMTSVSTGFAPSAYGVVSSGCLSNQSLAHEVGHTQGLMHDRASSSYGGAYPYSYGYRRCIDDGLGFRDIMSYPCTGAPRVLVFSNPYVTWSGYPSGVAYEGDAANSAENARTLLNTATTVAAFRTKVTDVPAAPSGLTTTSLSYNSVSLAWTDNAANESGSKVERSADGVSYYEIATLGADVRAYTDGTVSSRSNYYYRVREFNSAGNSAYSATLRVSTPDVPPPSPAAPTGVVAVDNRDGTATVAWTVDSDNSASSYQLRRQKWDSRKSVWGSDTTAATVPASVLSLVDSAGAGTYRYSVQALNAGGSSAAAGPANVTVTAATPSMASGKSKRK